MKTDIKKELDIPNEINIEIDKNKITIKGPNGKVTKKLQDPKIEIKKEEQKIILESKNATKKEKKKINTFQAHIKNMLKGAKEGHLYELKICSTHFPMDVKTQGNKLIVENFIGEKTPRELEIREKVEVNIDGDTIKIESADKDLAGTTASEIEKLTKIKGKDRRIFQDGIYITKKDGKKII